MICYGISKSVRCAWKNSMITDRKTGMELARRIRQQFERFFEVQQKRKRLIKGIWNGELIFKIGTAFGGLCCRLP
jgi:hypothetical protein